MIPLHVLVAFGRPKGDRTAYRQWEEEGIAPQVVFEILGPDSCLISTIQRQCFCDRFGVEEFYTYHPDTFQLTTLLREPDGQLKTQKNATGFVSPRLGICFDAPGDRPMTILRPDGVAFCTPQEMHRATERTQRTMEALRARLRQVNP